MRKLRILVTAVGGGVGQEILKALRMSGFELFVIGVDAEPFSAGFAFCDRAYRVPLAGDTEYRRTILKICSQEGIDYLFPGSDPELLPLAQMKPELLKVSCQAIVSDEPCIRICRDKLATFRFLSEREIPFAQTAPFSHLGELIERVGFPLVAKPIGGSASSGVKILFDFEDIHALREPETYVFQEYLVPIQWGKKRIGLHDVLRSGELRQEHEFSVQVLKGGAGETLGVFLSENMLKRGIPMRIEPRSLPEIEAVALSVAEALGEVGLFGPLNVQGKVTERGFTIFEVNPRFTGITATRSALGFRECEALLFELEGERARVASCLKREQGKVVLRFLSERIMEREYFEKLAFRNEGELSHANIPEWGKRVSGK
ncbi:MAG: hypothetical protein ACP5Q4_05925 [Candidatus Caldatribacteriaceae bacterium]